MEASSSSSSLTSEVAKSDWISCQRSPSLLASPSSFCIHWHKKYKVVYAQFGMPLRYIASDVQGRANNCIAMGNEEAFSREKGVETARYIC